MTFAAAVEGTPLPPNLSLSDWSLWLVLAVILAPAAARADDIVVFPDGRVLRVERAEVLPDRVRVETTGPVASELPSGVPFAATGLRTAELSRGEIRAVFPVPDLPGEARPHLERYGDITRQLTDRVRRDLQRSWSLPSPAGR